VWGMVGGRGGRSRGGDAPTLGVIGRLGGVGARPARTGYVSDGDGALAALACALHLARVRGLGDDLAGDVRFATHVCPRARIRPHHPVPYMVSPLTQAQMNEHEVDPAMDALLCFDTTRGNRLVNRRGIAVTATIKEGYILRVSEDLLDLLQNVTGRLPVVLPVSTQDITPYENGLYHLNSLLQPATATSAPVVGVAITAEAAVAGSATGASQLVDVEEAVRFGVEVANAYGERRCAFFDAEEFSRLRELYGAMGHLQTPGRNA
ncbi:MAG: DUF1177 domain-containing protein, partial [Candidatus Dormibacteraeota bacterium]|nr:DUF1177 domain-containing protein [Candidatus Dormibacteraeota bacterium]